MNIDDPARPEVSIVIVTYNSGPWIERCLDSIPAALDGRRAEIILVDNASSDDTVARTGNYPGVTLVSNVANRGFAAAVNQGAVRARGRWILLLNPDTESLPRAIGNLVGFAESHDWQGLYGGRTLREDGGLEPSSCWNLPTLWSIACFASGLSTLFPRSRVFDPESIGRWARDSVREVGMITGCLLLVRTVVWKQVGGLDERYFVYGEDADFAARARGLGFRPTITPDAVVVHAIGASSSDNSAKTVLLLAGKVTYLRLNWSGARQAAGLLLLTAGVALRAKLSKLSGRGRKWSDAWDQRAQWRDGFRPQDRAAVDRPITV